jgi:TonB dependent receptor
MARPWVVSNSTICSPNLEGIPRSASLQLGDPTRHGRLKQFAGFIQDDWRIKSTLTLNLGLRYEHSLPPTEVDGRLGNFDPTLGLVQVGKQIPTLVNPDNLDFAPRFGVAWDVRGNGKTVIRAGVTRVYETTGLSTYFSSVPFAARFITNGTTGPALNTPGIPSIATANFSYSGKGVLTCNPKVAAGTTCPTPGSIQYGWQNNSATNPLFFTGMVACGDGLANSNSPLASGNDPPACTTGAIDQNYKVPFVTTWSLDFQRQLTNDLSLSVTYLGNHGSRLLEQMDINQPHIGPSSVNGWYGTSAGTTSATTCLLSSAAVYNNCSPNSTDEQSGRTYNSQFPYLKFINQYRNGAISNYNGVQVSLNKRASHGLSFILGYTYAHSLDDVSSLSGPSPSYPQDTYNLGNEYATGDYDIRHRVSFSLTYALPGEKSFGQLLERWQINSILAVQSGLPWTAMDFNNDFLGTGDNTRGPTAQPAYWNFTDNRSDFQSNQFAVPFFSANNPDGSAPTSVAQAVANLPAACVNAADGGGATHSPHPWRWLRL